MVRRSLSIIIPVYNEGAGVRRFLDEKLLPVINKLPYKTELIVVDDGSTDRSFEMVCSSETIKKVPTTIIPFTKNFGKEIALTAGLERVKTDAVIMLDADGQHPVDAIFKMVEKWEQGAYTS